MNRRRFIEGAVLGACGLFLPKLIVPGWKRVLVAGPYKLLEPTYWVVKAYNGSWERLVSFRVPEYRDVLKVIRKANPEMMIHAVHAEYVDMAMKLPGLPSQKPLKSNPGAIAVDCRKLLPNP